LVSTQLFAPEARRKLAGGGTTENNSEACGKVADDYVIKADELK